VQDNLTIKTRLPFSGKNQDKMKNNAKGSGGFLQ
jgi:hypothetical protein